MSDKPDASLINNSPTKPPLYPMNWSFIANRIKEKAGWRCKKCRHLHDSSAGYTLTVHHKDHDTSNSSDDNLIALCQRCHLVEEGKYHQKLRQDRQKAILEASGQQIIPSFETILFP